MIRRSLLSCNRGASAAEFALVLPVLTLFLLGTIDVGRFLWDFNRAEKATQMGARFAVVTDVIEGGLASKSYVGTQVGGVYLTQGDRIPIAAFGSMSCNTTNCTCVSTCPTAGTYNETAFDNIVARMRAIYPAITDQNVTVEYRGSGLGFAGDPNGMDLSPLVTVRVTGLQFRPVASLLFGTVTMPAFATTLTAEDGKGSGSN